MVSDNKIIEIFCNLDDFIKGFDTVLTKTVFQVLQILKQGK